MILNELFDRTVPFKLTPTGLGFFSVNSKDYVVDFDDHNPAQVEVTFSLQQGEHLKTGVEGTGDELAVFSAVIAMIRQYISKRNVRSLVFAAKAHEPSQIRLYDHMVRKLAPRWACTSSIQFGEKTYRLDNPDFSKAPDAQHSGV